MASLDKASLFGGTGGPSHKSVLCVLVSLRGAPKWPLVLKERASGWSPFLYMGKTAWSSPLAFLRWPEKAPYFRHGQDSALPKKKENLASPGKTRELQDRSNWMCVDTMAHTSGKP